ncbi:hypothetical protein SK128_005858 [Halocaridina rubra]|uniref:Uncharacterized protein n=1 Tax=Halocaridina rubra TaxID=373956 RepID=A0AAN8X9G1_HALRR
MLFPCFGILYSGYLMERGATSMTTAWIFNIQGFIWNVMGILAKPLVDEFGWRNVGFISITLVSTSLVISAFAPSPLFLFFSLSLLSGIGGGLATSMCFLIVPTYFDRKRGMANAVMMAGICLGEILGPLLVRFLLDEYSFQGANIIIGAILLNSYIGISFFHPIKWHLKNILGHDQYLQSQPSRAIMNHNTDMVKNHLIVTINDSDLSKADIKAFMIKDIHLYQKLVPNSDVVSPLMKKSGVNDYSENRRSSISEYQIRRENTESSNFRRSSTFNSLILNYDIMMSTNLRESRSNSCFGNLHQTKDEKMQSPPISANSKKNINSTFRLIQTTFADLNILKSPRAAIIATGNMLCMNSVLNFVMMVPFAMQALDHSLQDSAWCISVSAICNLLTRLIVSPLSDWERFSMKLCYTGGYAVLAIAMLAFPMVSELRWLEVIMGLFGSALGANMALYNLVMIEYMGVENLAPVFGASGLMVGVGFLFFGTLTGLVRDITNSYAVSMWMLSAMSGTSFLLWLFMPTAVAYDECQAQKKKEDGNYVVQKDWR